MDKTCEWGHTERPCDHDVMEQDYLDSLDES